MAARGNVGCLARKNVPTGGYMVMAQRLDTEGAAGFGQAGGIRVSLRGFRPERIPRRDLRQHVGP